MSNICEYTEAAPLALLHPKESILWRERVALQCISCNSHPLPISPDSPRQRADGETLPVLWESIDFPEDGEVYPDERRVRLFCGK
jgi:hypothetical protein